MCLQRGPISRSLPGLRADAGGSRTLQGLHPGPLPPPGRRRRHFRSVSAKTLRCTETTRI